MSRPADYSLPTETVGLTGPVRKPAPGTKPLRGDLAHIALAGQYLATQYVVPLCREIGPNSVHLRLAMREDADIGASLPAGTPVELLDCAGEWAWIACGPEGPSGYVQLGALEPTE